jgi:hypothetical protein
MDFILPTVNEPNIIAWLEYAGDRPSHTKPARCFTATRPWPLGFVIIFRNPRRTSSTYCG